MSNNVLESSLSFITALHSTRHLLQVDESSTGSSDPWDKLPFTLDFNGGGGIAGVTAIVTLACGILLLFLGARLIKATVWITCLFFVGGSLFYIIYTQTGNALSAFLVGLLVGLAVACLVCCLWKLAAFGIGGLAGFVCWLGFRTLFPNAIGSEAGLYILLAICIIGVGIIAVFFSDLVLIVGTSILGSFLVSQGLNHWWVSEDTKFDFNVFRALHGNSQCDVSECYGVAAVWLFLAAVGCLIQLKWTRGLWPNSKSDNPSCCPCIPFCPV